MKISFFLTLFVFCLGVVETTFASPDTVDSTFAGSAGQIFDPTQFGGVASSIVQSDGKVIFGSNEMGGTVNGSPLQIPLIRLNPDGTVDSTFGADNAPNGGGLGIVYFRQGFSEVHDMALQADGKLIAAGVMEGYSDNGTTVTHGGQSIVRFNVDGTPDPTFATRGTTQSGSLNYINDVEVQSDGKILAAGGFGGVRNSDFTFFQRPGLVRFLADGAVDPSFNLNFADYPGVPTSASGFVRDVEVSAGGEIYAAIDFSAGLTEYFHQVCRLRPDGSRDFSFNPDFSGDFIQALNLDRDGNLIVLGRNQAETVSFMERFFPDGTKDPSFTLDPSLGLVSGEQLEESPTGQYYLATDGGTRAVRINRDGSLDPAFNVTNAYPDNPSGTPSSFFRCFTLSPDGSVYAGSFFSSVDSVSTKKIVKFEGNPTPGTSVIQFAESNIRTIEGGRTLTLTAIRTGDLSTSASAVVSLTGGTADGSDFTAGAPFLLTWPAGVGGALPFSFDLLDDTVEDGDKTLTFALGNPTGATIGTNGTLLLTILDDEAPATITAPPASPTFVSGQNATFHVGFTSATATTFQWKLNGDLIPGATGVTLTLSSLSPALNGTTVTVEITNAGGTTPSAAATITVTTPDGSRDFSFPGDLGALPLARNLNLLFDNSIVFNAGTGGFATPLRLSRILPDGSLDLNFGPEFLNGAGTTVISKVTVGPDGKIYVRGSFNTVGGIARDGLVRLTSSGQVDTFFSPPTGLQSNLFVASSGLIYVSLGGNTGLVRLLEDGSIDPNFSPGIGNNSVSKVIYAITEDAAGRIYAADFVSNNPNGFPARLLRLLPSGKLDLTFAAPPLSSVTTLTALSDGRLAVGQNGSVVLLTENGLPDPSFAVPSGVLSSVGQIHEDRGGLIVTGGNKLVRLLQNGAVDSSFPAGPGGPITEVLSYTPGRLLMAAGGTEFNGGTVPSLFSTFARNPTIDFTTGGLTVAENAGSFEVSIRAAGNLDSPLTATLVSVDGTALASTHFTPVSESLTFDSDNPMRTVSVSLIDDLSANPTRTFKLRLSSPDLASSPEFQVTLLDDESAPIITAQPQNLVVLPGTTASLSVSLADAAGATIRWFRNGRSINNATNFTYQPLNDAAYYAEVTRGGVTVRTEPAAVTFLPDGSAVKNGFGFSSPLGQNPVKVIRTDALGAAYVGAQSSGVNRALSRVLPDNTLDPAWTPAIAGTVFDLAVEPHGAVVIAGDLNIVDSSPILTQLARYQPDGSRDLAFQSNLGTGPGASGTIRIVSRYPNGDLLVGGNFGEWNGISLPLAPGLVKLDSEGNRIVDFVSGLSGTVKSAVALPDGGAVAIYGSQLYQLDATGAIVRNRFLGSGIKKVIPAGGGKWLVVANDVTRLNAEFNTEQVFPITKAETAVVQANGKVIVGGTFISSGRRKIARFLADGTIDPTFSTANGLRTFNEADGNLVTSLAERPDGSIWVGGTFPGYGPANQVNFPNLALINGDAISLEIVTQPVGGFIAVDQDITLSATVASDLSLTYQWFRDGLPVTDAPGIAGTQTATLALSAPVISGEYRLRVSGGPATVESSAAFVGVLAAPAIRRISENLTTASDLPIFLQVEAYGAGSLRYQWFKNGAPIPGETSALLAFPLAQPANTGTYTVAITNDLDTTTSDPIVVTVLQNGASIADSYQSPSLGGDVLDLLVLPGDRVLLGGSFSSFFSAGFTVNGGRYLGVMNTDGTITPDLGLGINNSVQSLALQPDGKIIAGGLFTQIGGLERKRLARLNPDLTIDESFNPGELFANFANIKALVIDPDGKILVVHSNNALNYLVRLLPDGTQDPTFTASPNSLVEDLIALPDGTYLVSGNFTQWSGNSTGSRLVKIANDGSLLPTPDYQTANASISKIHLLPSGHLLAAYSSGTFQVFDELGQAVTSDFDGFNTASITDEIIFSSSGQLIFGGNFSTLNGQPTNRLFATDSAGQLDPAFDIGTGFNSRVRTLAEAENGNLWVAGTFTQYNGSPANRIVLLKGNEQAPVTRTFADFIAETNLTGNDALFTADPDRDGLPNGLEFLLAGDPEIAEPNLIPAPVVRPASELSLSDGQSYLTLDLSIAEDLIDLPWSVQASTDLSFINPDLDAAIPVGQPIIDNGLATYRFRLPWPTSDPRSRGFLRLSFAADN